MELTSEGKKFHSLNSNEMMLVYGGGWRDVLGATFEGTFHGAFIGAMTTRHPYGVAGGAIIGGVDGAARELGWW